MKTRQQHQKSEFIKTILKCIPAIVILCFIFTMSGKNAEESSEESNAVTMVIVEAATFVNLLPAGVDEAMLDAIDNVVREAAHFTEYFVLGISLCLAMSSFFLRTWRSYMGLFLFAICYAVSDEIHQYFVPGRCFQILDITVDSLGAVTGILIWKMMGRRKK